MSSQVSSQMVSWTPRKPFLTELDREVEFKYYIAYQKFRLSNNFLWFLLEINERNFISKDGDEVPVAGGLLEFTWRI